MSSGWIWVEYDNIRALPGTGIADLGELALKWYRERYGSRFERAIARVATPRLMTWSSNAAGLSEHGEVGAKVTLAKK